MDRNYLLNKKERYPSREFSIKTGLDFVYRDWVLPKEGHLVMVDVIDRGGYEVYKEILALNPDIVLNITQEMIDGYKNDLLFGEFGRDIYYHVCYGLVSKFNLDDIQYFLESSYGDNRAHKAEYRKYKDKVEKLIGHSMGWATSYKTMDKVRELLNK